MSRRHSSAVGSTRCVAAAVLATALLASFASLQPAAAAVGSDDAAGGSTGRGGDSAPLNVHLICHTHDDVGWLKTVDEYYVGSKNDIQKAGVQYILDNVVTSLVRDPKRRFVYVEMAFFVRWWDEQTDNVKETVKSLVANRQLTFANGGWCMHDEAAAHYVAMIEQTTLGHRFLNETFGYIPTVGWQIDPFGHSTAQAYLLGHDAGFTSMLLGRSDHNDLALRKIDKSMEFEWIPSDNFDGGKSIFTQVRPDGNYNPPAGFCFDYDMCNVDPIVDDASLEGYNVDAKVEAFVQAALSLGNQTRGNDIMFMQGSDFQYMNAEAYFKNLDKLIAAVNKDGRVNAFYSTPEDYFEVKMKDAQNPESPPYPKQKFDFFPYSDADHSYWTGYFTSRPTSKGYIREMTSFLQAARWFEYLQVPHPEEGSTPWTHAKDSTLQTLERAVSIAQHHDAITGTEKQAVADDYARRLYSGFYEAAPMYLAGLAKAIMHPDDELTLCPLLNVSICDPAATASVDNKPLTVVVYNNLPKYRNEALSIPINWNPDWIDPDTHNQDRYEDGGQHASVCVLELSQTGGPPVMQTVQIDLHSNNEEHVKDSKADITWRSQMAPKGASIFVVFFGNPLPELCTEHATLSVRQNVPLGANTPDVRLGGPGFSPLSATIDGSTGRVNQVSYEVINPNKAHEPGLVKAFKVDIDFKVSGK